MDSNSRIPMARTVKIIRRSIYLFLQNYHSFTTAAAILALPLAALALISDVSFPSLPLLRAIFNRLQSLFDAAGLPRSSDFFTFLNLKLSQTIATSFLTIPFTLSFFLLAKAFVIQVLCNRKPASKSPSYSFLSIYTSLLLTQLCNILIVFAANATCICFLFFTFSCADGLGLLSAKSLPIFSATLGVIYSIILANALVICNLASTISGMENRGGFLAILNSCLLIKGRTGTAFSLALPINFLLAAVEALFQYRVVKAYHYAISPLSSTVLEGLLIVYMYSILLVLDIVISCTFHASCKATTSEDHQSRRCSCCEDIEEKDMNACSLLKRLDGLA